MRVLCSTASTVVLVPRRVPFVASLVAVAFGLAVASPEPAHAAGRLPASNAVVFDPHDSKGVLVRTTFGLLSSRDGGGTWRWICDQAIGSPETDEPPWVVTPKGTIVGATSTGVVASRDGGCSFTRSTEVLKGLVVRQNGELLGVASTAAGESRFDNHLLVSKDDAQAFAVDGGPIDPTLGVDSVAIAASEPGRIYLAGRRGEGVGSFVASYDGGMSWLPRKLDLVAGETPIVAGVDPANADRVYVRTTGEAVHARLLVTSDAGKTWRKVFDAPSETLGFALSDDGKRAFVGTREGVSSSPSDAFAFTKGSSIEARCLAASGSTLWACSTEKSGFFVGSSRTGGRSFDANLHLEEIKGPLECPNSTTVAKQCVDAWPKLRRELGLPDVGDAPPSVGGGGGSPSLRGRATRTGRAVNMRMAAVGIALFGFAAYSALKRLRRRR